jgi:aspartate/methionine/tyrosine aminotransferase
MMRRAHVAVTPGRDFGHATTERFVRLSFASSMAHLEEALARLGRELGGGPQTMSAAAGQQLDA